MDDFDLALLKAKLDTTPADKLRDELYSCSETHILNILDFYSKPYDRQLGSLLASYEYSNTASISVRFYDIKKQPFPELYALTYSSMRGVQNKSGRPHYISLHVNGNFIRKAHKSNRYRNKLKGAMLEALHCISPNQDRDKAILGISWNK